MAYLAAQILMQHTGLRGFAGSALLHALLVSFLCPHALLLCSAYLVYSLCDSKVYVSGQLVSRFLPYVYLNPR